MFAGLLRGFTLSAGVLGLAACAASPGSIGGTDCAPQYDKRETQRAENKRPTRAKIINILEFNIITK